MENYSQINDYYERLGVTPTAKSDEIKRAYRTRAMDCHPDRNPNNTVALENFIAVSKAYDTLSDPILRREYDLERVIQGRQQPIKPNTRTETKPKPNYEDEFIIYQNLFEKLIEKVELLKKMYKGRELLQKKNPFEHHPEIKENTPPIRRYLDDVLSEVDRIRRK